MDRIFHIPHGWDDPNAWLWLALLGFVVLIVVQKVPQKLIAALDSRSEDIQAKLDEARRLREDAQELLAVYQRRQREAEAEAKQIVEQARAEAERMAQSSRRELAERLERRTAMAEAKIAQAEADAIASVRERAADLAASAAAVVLQDTVDAARHQTIIDASIADLQSKL